MVKSNLESDSSSESAAKFLYSSKSKPKFSSNSGSSSQSNSGTSSQSSSQSGSLDIFALGTPVVDYFAKCDDEFLKSNDLAKGASNFIPRENVDSMCLALGKEIFHVAPGDNARNVCEGISYLGGKCAFAGAIADDSEGKIFKDGLAKMNISDFTHELGGVTGKILCLITPDKQRTFAVNLGNSERYSKKLIGDVIGSHAGFFFSTSITYLSKDKISGVCAETIKYARDAGIQNAFSLESPPMIKANSHRLFALLESGKIDVLFGNESEFEALEALPENLVNDGLVRICVLKKGAQGATVFYKSTSKYSARLDRVGVPAIKCDVLDTTGAGDYFAAGFLFGLSSGKPIDDCGRIGAQLATRVISKFGASVF